ncbi:Werner Syndrome-like exonuclease [Salvia hispanica]|uniref:Werner Syndrome-like exonuclease n=1 Tax=Salvia hispanica TaxID=49212 RepID=UPI00200915D6|nr:Werner Syndrome-like exonuclease [Salvia hispanica]
MAITIAPYAMRENTYEAYNVRFFDQDIYTTVTANYAVVTDWIGDVKNLHSHEPQLTVGLDVEWRPSFASWCNPVATLPRIKEDMEKLQTDYGIGGGARYVDLRGMAVEVYSSKLKNAGLKKLASVVLRKEVEKPQWVRVGRWDAPRLSAEQVQYACVDAYLSSEIARALHWFADLCERIIEQLKLELGIWDFN